jgi:type VI protein secretion system component Hcp
MAQANPVDIIMMLKEVGSSNGIEAESMSAVDAKDVGWTDDFKPGQYFEIEDFTLGIDIEDNDSAATAPTAPTLVTGKDGKPIATQPKSGKFTKWTQGTAATAGPGLSTLYPVQMDAFSFTRQMDFASPKLFKNCFKTIPFDSATIVMRKTGGVMDKKTGIGHMAFLRIDFTGVLITSIDWDGGEVVKEKCKMVCRTVEVKYRAQNHDGTPGKPALSSKLDLKKATSGAGC